MVSDAQSVQDAPTMAQPSPADLLEDLKAKIKGGQQQRVNDPFNEESTVTRPPRLKLSEGSHAVEEASSASPDGQTLRDTLDLSDSSMPPNIPPDSLAPTESDDQPPQVDDILSDQSLGASGAGRKSSPERLSNYRSYPPRDNNTTRGGRFERDYNFRKRSMSDVKRPPPEERHYEPDYRAKSPPRGDNRRFQREPHPLYAKEFGQPMHEERGRLPLPHDRDYRPTSVENHRRYNEPPRLPPGRISPGPPARSAVRVADTYRPAPEPRYRSPPPPRSPPTSFAQRPIDRRDALSSRLPRDYSPPMDARPRRSLAIDDDRRRPLSPPPGRYTKDFTRGDARPSERGRGREEPYVPLEERLSVRPPSLQERLNVGNSPPKTLGERLSSSNSSMNRSSNLPPLDRDRDAIPRRLDDMASHESISDRRGRPRSGSRGRADIRETDRPGVPVTRARNFSPPTAADLARDKERAMRERQRPAPPVRRPFSPPSAADIARDRERARDHQKQRASPARPPVYARDDDRDRRGSESGRGGYGIQTRYSSDRPRDVDPPYVDPGYSRRSPGPAYPSRIRPRSPSPAMSVKRARDDAYAAAPYWEKDSGRGYEAPPPVRSYGRAEPQGRPRSPAPLRPSASYDDLSRGRPPYAYDPTGRKSPPISYDTSRPRSPGASYDRSRQRSPPPYQRDDRRYMR